MYPENIVTGSNSVDLLRPNVPEPFMVPADTDNVIFNMSMLASTLTSVTVSSDEDVTLVINLISRGTGNVETINVSFSILNIFSLYFGLSCFVLFVFRFVKMRMSNVLKVLAI